MMMVRAEHHRGKRLLMHKQTELYFYIYTYICMHICVCDSFVAGFCVRVGVCVCDCVCIGVRGCVCGICCVGFSQYRKCVISLFVLVLFPLLLYSSFFHLSFPLHHPSFILSHDCHLSLSGLNSHQSLLAPFPPPTPCPPPHLFSLIPPTPADLHPLSIPARRCVNMASRSLLTCVAPSGTASSLC